VRHFHNDAEPGKIRPPEKLRKSLRDRGWRMPAPDCRRPSYGQPLPERESAVWPGAWGLARRRGLRITRQQQGGNEMKQTILALSCAALVAGTALGADVVTTTTSSSGTLHEYVPGSTFVVKESSGPVTYRYGKKVTYVTKSGRVLSDADVKTHLRVGRPVRVQYDTIDDARIVNRVEIDDDGEVEVDADNDDDD
jgi:hypothetical protein